MVSIAPPTASQLRRSRAMATRRRLFETIASTSAKAESITTMEAQLESLLAAVTELQSMLSGSIIYMPCPMPEQVIGQDLATSMWYPCANVPWEPWHEQPITNSCDANDEDALHSDIPSEPPKNDYCNWVPNDYDPFSAQCGITFQELQVEAAICIQRWFLRGSTTCNDESYFTSNYSESVMCAGCNKIFSQNSDEADACDDCSAPIHIACAHILPQPLEPYRVCAVCAQIRKDNGQDSCDDEPVDEHERTAQDAGIPNHIHPNEAESGTTMAAKVDDPFKPLEVCLDYVIRFVEGEHVKSDRISSEARSMILARVKAFLSWKKRDRTKEDIQRAIDDLNAMMVDIVSRL